MYRTVQATYRTGVYVPRCTNFYQINAEYGTHLKSALTRVFSPFDTDISPSNLYERMSKIESGKGEGGGTRFKLLMKIIIKGEAKSTFSSQYIQDFH